MEWYDREEEFMHQSIPVAIEMPHPGDWQQGGQMPRSSPGGGGAWVQLELTDVLVVKMGRHSPLSARFSVQYHNLSQGKLKLYHNWLKIP